MKCSPRTLRAGLGLVLVLTACSEEAEPGTAGGQATATGDNVPGAAQDQGLPSVDTPTPYTFAEWHGDFPYELHVPTRRAGKWYARNRQQALEKVIANVSGLCSKPAWLMTKDFFDRHWDEAAELVIEKADETMRRHDRYDHAENLVNVMGHCRDPRFAAVLTRAAAHEHPGIRRAALRALYNAGDEKSLMAIGQGFGRMSRVEQVDWLKAAARHLSDKNLFPLLRPMMTRQEFVHLQTHAFEEAIKLPAERAARLFDPIWNDMPKDLALIVAGVFHEIGDGRGTARLRHALKPPVEIPQRKKVAIIGAARGDAKVLLDELLRLTLEDNEDLNLQIITAIRKVDDPRVNDTLLMLTDKNKPFEVRQYSLRALAERGETSELDHLLDVVRNEAKGGRLQSAIADLVGARYAPAAAALLERAKNSPRAEEPFHIRMIARLNRPESFTALKEIFLAPERVYPLEKRHSNVTFLGVQLANVDVAQNAMLELLDQLPRADYRRRAALIHALANIASAHRIAAGDDGEEAWVQSIYDRVRGLVFDRKEVPQLRILALDYIRKDIRLSDAMKLRQLLRQEEDKGMRQYFSDYLFEFF